MSCFECNKEIGKMIFFRQGQEKEKFCSNECCNKYWEKEILQSTCSDCNGKIREGDYYYKSHDDPNLKVCTFCHRWGGDKSKAEKEKKKNEREIVKLKEEVERLENDSRSNENIEIQNFLNFKKQRLQELERQQNNDPSRQRNSNKSIPNPNSNNKQDITSIHK